MNQIVNGTLSSRRERPIVLRGQKDEADVLVNLFRPGVDCCVAVGVVVQSKRLVRGDGGTAWRGGERIVGEVVGERAVLIVEITQEETSKSTRGIRVEQMMRAIST